jgi:Prp8 binding protein
MSNTPAPKRRRGDDGSVLNDTRNDASTTASPSVTGPQDSSATTTVASGTAIQKYTPSQGTSSSSSSSSSTLPCPTLQLTGHTGSVYALKYSPSGSTLCSTSFDMTCLLWEHRPMELDEDYDDDDDYNENFVNTSPFGDSNWNTSTVATYNNFHTLKGHKNAVLDCAWCDNHVVVTASADYTLMLWDIASQQRLRKYVSHTSIVNAVAMINVHQFVSVSDDTTVVTWDRRSKHPTSTLKTDFPVLAVASSTGITSDYQIYTAGIDPVIRIWDVRSNAKQQNQPQQDDQQQQLDQLHGHSDTVTCLSVHPDGTHLLSNSMDQSLMQWDIRPFVQPSSSHHSQRLHARHVRSFIGHQHSAEKGLLKCSWSADGSLVTAGSSDTRVHIWDVVSGQELYDLPGHKGCVHTVTFHPTEATVIASGSSDKQIFVGELS